MKRQGQFILIPNFHQPSLQGHHGCIGFLRGAFRQIKSEEFDVKRRPHVVQGIGQGVIGEAVQLCFVKESLAPIQAVGIQINAFQNRGVLGSQFQKISSQSLHALAPVAGLTPSRLHNQ